MMYLYKIIIVFALSGFIFSQNLEYSIISSDFKKPLFLTSHNSKPNILYIIEQRGMIWNIENNGKSKKIFLDIRDRVHNPIFPGDERGLLGLAISPGYINNNLIYLNYINKNNETIISRFNAQTNFEEILLQFEQPYSNHNGGMMAFGPDGYLYISIGDGGSAGDPHYNAQTRENFFGSILRIDVNVDSGYLIPESNPFINTDNFKPEIWSYGLRNVWRFSFDRLTGDLYMGDVGQNSWEEINFQKSSSRGGKNYGWNHYEGLALYNESEKLNNVEDPIYVYPNNANILKVLVGWSEDDVYGCSITGGYVYRGDNIPDFKGYYIFADYCTGRIWSFKYIENKVSQFSELTETLNLEAGTKTVYISSFGEDIFGELYIIDYSGSIYKIEADF